MASLGCRMIRSVCSVCGFVITWIEPGGAPAPSAAAAQIRTASRMHRRAPRCGLKITGLRVFMQISALKIAVEVGLVTGTVARIGPRGRASSVMPLARSSETTPTVRRARMSS